MRDALRAARGQATVELALCLPLLALVFAALVELAMVGVDQVRVWNAAREGARAAAVDPSPAAASDAARRTGPSGAVVTVEPPPAQRAPGRPVTVEVAYPYDSRVPLLGRLFERIVLGAEATMRIERA